MISTKKAKRNVQKLIDDYSALNALIVDVFREDGRIDKEVEERQAIRIWRMAIAYSEQGTYAEVELKFIEGIA